MIPVNASKGLDTTTTSGMEIKISGITNLSDAQQAEIRLKSLSSVHSVEWLAIHPRFVIFRLTLDGDRNRLRQMLEIDERLTPAISEQELDVLHYQFWP